MRRDRLAAFSDGVLAIIITIMVLELKPPAGTDWLALKSILPTLSGYILSFIYVGIYWNNHHHLLHTVERVTGDILWANMHLLFWLSLMPFATAWLGQQPFNPVPTLLYGVTLLMPAIAYYLLQRAIIHRHGRSGQLARALGRDIKGKGSIALYLLGIGLALEVPVVSVLLYVLVALIWLVPDRRIECAIEEEIQAIEGNR